jgi:hypothetical protein
VSAVLPTFLLHIRLCRRLVIQPFRHGQTGPINYQNSLVIDLRRDIRQGFPFLWDKPLYCAVTTTRGTHCEIKPVDGAPEKRAISATPANR